MRVLIKLLVMLVVFVFVRSCQQSKNNEPTPPIEPFAIIENNGAEHRLYRGATLLEVVRTLPASSVDTLDIDSRPARALIAVVTFPLGNNKVSDLQTTFKLKNGQSFVKRWLPVRDNQDKIAIGVFEVTDKVVDCSTEIKPSTAR